MMHMSRMFSGAARPFRIAPFWGFLVLFVGLGMIGGFWGNGWFHPRSDPSGYFWSIY